VLRLCRSKHKRLHLSLLRPPTMIMIMIMIIIIIIKLPDQAIP
jgi:hypothetical protein